MNCPLHRTNVLGFLADSVGSGTPATRNSAGGMGLVGWRNYRLTETIPTA